MHVQVAHSLDGQTVQARVDGARDVVFAEFGDRLLAEVRHEMAADVRLSVGERGVLLAASARQLSDPPVADIFDGQAVRHGRLSVGAAMTAIGFMLFTGIEFSLADVPNKLTPSAAQALNLLDNDFFFPTIAGRCIFEISRGLAIIRTAPIPE